MQSWKFRLQYQPHTNNPTPQNNSRLLEGSCVLEGSHRNRGVLLTAWQLSQAWPKHLTKEVNV